MDTRLLVYAAMGIMALGILFYVSSVQQERFFTTALTDAGITLAEADTLKAKRTIYARTLAEQNPLLALPGTDLDRFNGNITALAALEEQFAEVNASSSDATLLRALFPIDFLSSLSELERARRQFVLSGSGGDKAEYERLALAAFDAYERDARAFKSAFARAMKMQRGRYATDGDIVSRADMLSSIDTLVERMRETKARFVARMRCTRGDLLKCVSADLQAPSIPITPERAVTSAELAQARIVRSINAEAHQDTTIAEGPMYLLPSTKCVANIPGAPLFAFYIQLGAKSYSGPFPMLVGNIRFNNTDTERAGPGFKAFSSALKQRVDYIVDSPLLHYTCIELAHDSGSLFVMRDTYNFAQTQLISQYASTSVQKQALATLENRNLEIVSAHMVEKYLNTARTLPLPATLAAPVRELALAYVFKSDRFDANLGEILNDETSNLALVRLGWPISTDVPYAFFIRSSAQMLLLADNQSAVGTVPRLFPQNTIPAEEEPFIYYSQLPQRSGLVAQLVRDINFFYSIHIDPHLTGL